MKNTIQMVMFVMFEGKSRKGTPKTRPNGVSLVFSGTGMGLEGPDRRTRHIGMFYMSNKKKFCQTPKNHVRTDMTLVFATFRVNIGNEGAFWLFNKSGGGYMEQTRRTRHIGVFYVSN